MHRARWRGSFLALGLIVAAPAAANDLSELGLRDLLAIRLNTIGISSIHHTHAKGEWMVGLDYMFMHMNGNRSRGTRLSRSRVLEDFMVAPLRMDMQMYMLNVMYAPTERLTAMVMVPYHVRAMDHVTRMGARFTTRSEGFGDVMAAGLFKLVDRSGHEIVLKAGLSFPTGTTTAKDDTPMGRVRLPYPMQIGSGTWDPILGLTYLGQSDAATEKAAWVWGAHAEGRFRTGRNPQGYQLGDRADVSAWIARELASWVSTSFRLHGQVWTNLSGADDALNPAMVPTADPDRRAGRRIDALVGLNLFQNDGPLGGNRIALEGGVPVYQWLDGPQLETDYRVSASWNWTF